MFCQIVAGALPARVVAEDEHTTAFLDRTPLFPGHVLLVPKPHVETLADLPDDLIDPLFAEARQAVGGDGVGPRRRRVVSWP